MLTLPLGRLLTYSGQRSERICEHLQLIHNFHTQPATAVENTYTLTASRRADLI